MLFRLSRDGGCVWAFVALRNLEVHGVADLEVVVGDSLELLCVEEEVFSLALACNEAEAPVRERLDGSCCHCTLFVCVVLLMLETRLHSLNLRF